jgi:putative Holliday junction resolvase
MAIDFGERRIGLAVSDPLGIVARGAGVIENDARLFDRLHAIIAEYQVRIVVVGMPYRADGSRGTKAGKIDQFIARLHETTDIPIETLDESFTSVEAARMLREGGMRKRQRQQKGRVDEMAARLLLQGYLDSVPRTPEG